MHTELLTAPHQPALAVVALLLLSGANLFGAEAPLTASVLALPQEEEKLPAVTPSEEPERLAA